MSYQDIDSTPPPPPEVVVSSCSYQVVQIIEYSRKAETQSHEQVIQSAQLLLQHKISIGLCN